MSAYTAVRNVGSATKNWRENTKILARKSGNADASNAAAEDGDLGFRMEAAEDSLHG